MDISIITKAIYKEWNCQKCIFSNGLLNPNNTSLGEKLRSVVGKQKFTSVREKMLIKSVKRFFRMSQGQFNPKIWFLCARAHRVITERTKASLRKASKAPN